MTRVRAHSPGAEAPTASRAERHTGAHPLHRLQRQAGNAAVAQLLSVQREGPTGQAAPTTSGGATEQGQVRIDAHEVTPTGSQGAGAQGDGSQGAAPQGGATAQPAQKQFQVQYAFQGQATQAPRQANQLAGAHQLTAQLNVSHHDDDHPGTEQSYAAQGTVDAATGHFTGAVFQVQDALVTATRHHLQGQLFANVSVGGATDTAGVVRPVAQAGIGAQGGVVINQTFTVFVQAQDQASLMLGPRGAVVSNSEQVSAGVQITFP